MSKTYIEEAKERWGDTAAWQEFENDRIRPKRRAMG